MHLKSLHFHFIEKVTIVNVNVKPFSRRTNRRRSDKTSTFGQPNNAFLLEDLPPSSSCRQSRVSDAENDAAAATSDHRDTDDDDQSVANRRASSCVALSTTNTSRRASAAGGHHADRDCTTTCVVVERPASTCEFDDNTQLVSNECNIILQPSTAPASAELTSAESTT